MPGTRPRPGRPRGAVWLAIAVSLAGCAAPPLVHLRPEPAHHAWWLRTRFEPHGPALRGLPARDVDAGWCAVDELSPSHFATIGRDDVQAADAPAPRYAADGPHVDSRPTTLVLAVFRTCAGATGTALVLLEGGQRATRAITAEVVSMPAAYAALAEVSPDVVRVAHCLECDAIDTYDWDAGRRRFVPRPDPEGE